MTFYFEKFLYTYLIFLFFVFFVIGLGGPDMFGGNFKEVITVANTSRSDLLEESIGTEPGYTGLTGFFEWAFGGINSALGVDTWLENNLTPFHNFVQNIWFFFAMSYADSSIGWVTTLFMAPAGIFLLYGLIKLARGGG